MSSSHVVRVALPEEAELVSEVLAEAAAWLSGRGIPLWNSADVSVPAIAQDVTAGLYVLSFLDDIAVATAKITLEDRQFWPDAKPGEATYVHRLAVRRSHAGGVASAVLLHWAEQYTTSLGRNLLRLDCDAARPRLRALYERFGFAFESERQVGPYRVARYQKVLSE